MKRIRFHSGSQAFSCLLHTSRYLLSKRLYAGSHKSPETPVCCAVLLVCWQNTCKKWSNSSVITTAGYCEFNWKLKDDPLKTEAANLCPHLGLKGGRAWSTQKTMPLSDRILTTSSPQLTASIFSSHFTISADLHTEQVIVDQHRQRSEIETET